MRELYGPEFHDSTYFSSLKEFLHERNFQRGLEVGFAWGMSTCAFLETNPGKLTTIDLDDQMSKRGTVEAAFGDRWQLVTGDSSSLLKALTDKYDWIYIDGDHSYEGVKKDIEAAWPLLADGGVFVCDDYINSAGIRQAVDEFVAQNNLELQFIPKNPNGGVQLCRKPQSSFPSTSPTLPSSGPSKSVSKPSKKPSPTAKKRAK